MTSRHTEPPARTFAVKLVDRRTGLVHRLNGRPLVCFTRNPDAVVTDLLDGRDAALWEARVEPIQPRGIR